MSENIAVEFKNAVIMQQSNLVLKDVNLQIKQGEFVYLIGKVGSGKSSLLKTIYAEIPIVEGEAFVCGISLNNIKRRHMPNLRRKCGIVFQDFRLLSDRSVYDNLLFVLKATGWKSSSAIKDRINSVLTKTDMETKGYKMPHELSGGEQQRVVIARALLNSPDIILADEPTGNIDPETSFQLITLLKDICDSGKTVIIATHQYDLIDKFPARILRCDNSFISECDSIPKSDVQTVSSSTDDLIV
ncbi:MAG: ATP-binding cassette domain-containing protein [Marinifilaceae bacterium]|jgi:cell division transport system ATP-binding protein